MTDERRKKAQSGFPSEKTAARRDVILGAVYDLISIHGIQGMTMRDVAAATGMSTGTINYHFGSKQRLVIAALEAAYRLPSDWNAGDGSARDRLRRLLGFFVLRQPEDRWWRFFTDFVAQATREEDLRIRLRERFVRQHLFWQRVVEEGQRVGEIDPALSAATVADELLSVAHGLIVMQHLLQGDNSAARVTAVIERAIDGIP